MYSLYGRMYREIPIGGFFLYIKRPIFEVSQKDHWILYMFVPCNRTILTVLPLISLYVCTCPRTTLTVLPVSFYVCTASGLPKRYCWTKMSLIWPAGASNARKDYMHHDMNTVPRSTTFLPKIHKNTDKDTLVCVCWSHPLHVTCLLNMKK